MTRKYEIVYIFDSALDETAINASLDRHHALLKTSANSNPVTESNHWGKRTLAYPIKDRQVGYYVVVQLSTDGNLLGEFERSVKLDDGIIRYLIVLNEGEVPVPLPDPAARTDDESAPKAPAAPKAEPSEVS